MSSLKWKPTRYRHVIPTHEIMKSKKTKICKANLSIKSPAKHHVEARNNIKPGGPINISKISSQGQILKDMNWRVYASARV